MDIRPTGMARKIDDLGRIVLPAEIRRAFGITEGDLIEIAVEQERIILQKVQERCIFCASDIDLLPHEGKLVCQVCRKALGATL